MTIYTWIAFAGIATGCVAYIVAPTAEAFRDRLQATLIVAGTGLFIYGLFLSIAGALVK